MPEHRYSVEKTEDEWKRDLSPDAFRVLRKHGTERAGTSPLNHEKRGGAFLCAACGAALFGSDAKYESGSGWPSFFKPESPDAVATSADRGLGITRTEVHCARCGGHLGHVFQDGPQPTGRRYCINGAALNFQPKED